MLHAPRELPPPAWRSRGGARVARTGCEHRARRRQSSVRRARRAVASLPGAGDSTDLMTDDDLRWRLGARLPGHDYRVFKTGFVEATHPRVDHTKQFSLIEAVDWVNVLALTKANEVVLLKQYRPGIDQVCLEIP